MIKSELVDQIAGQNPHLYHRDVERIVNAVLDEIVRAMGQGDRVEFDLVQAEKGPAAQNVTRLAT